MVSIVHAFDLLGRSARVDVRLPQQHARWEGLLDGEPRTVDRRGLADPRLRLAVDLLGAPALRGREFAAYRAAHPVNTVVGAAVAVTLPLGEYLKDKLLNLGQNRFAIQPQLGVVHTRGPWSYELTGSVSFFTDNDDFLVNQTREQDPVLLVQAHTVYADPRGWWLSLGAAYDWGGRSTVDGVVKGDYREDLLYGISSGLAINRQLIVQVAYVANRDQTEIGSIRTISRSVSRCGFDEAFGHCDRVGICCGRQGGGSGAPATCASAALARIRAHPMPPTAASAG